MSGETRAALLAPYAICGMPSTEWIAAIEPTKMTEPPPLSRRRGTAAFVSCSVPFTLTVDTESQSSRSPSIKPPTAAEYAATCTTQSKRP